MEKSSVPTIYLVIPGETTKKLNPALTEKGEKQIRRAREKIKNEDCRLPEKFNYVVSGEGKRHLKTSKIIWKEPGITPLIGTKGIIVRDIIKKTITFSSEEKSVPLIDYIISQDKERLFEKIWKFIKKILDKGRGNILLVGDPMVIKCISGHYSEPGDVFRITQTFGEVEVNKIKNKAL